MARKPESPTDLAKPSWALTGRNALAEFGQDECTDLAAALTYYAVLSLFPALLALVSLLGVVGQSESTTKAMLDLVRQLGQTNAADQLRGPIEEMTRSHVAGLGLVLGIVGALWAASGYVGAFGRAMNRIYGVAEGRPVWKLRPVQLVVTVVLVLLTALVLVGLVVSGPVAHSVGDLVGAGSTLVTIWNVLKWPVILFVVVLIVALLYYATPNIRQPRFRWISVGAVIAILAWVVGSVLFGFYVSHFGSYNKTYGSLAGVVVFLLWLWLTNVALLLGAEVDAELERARELQAGIAAEESIQLPPRDTRTARKREAKQAERVARGRALRQGAGEDARGPGAEEDREHAEEGEREPAAEGDRRG
jgi:membrane protein